jgi:geranylgeranyl diphosphate synthase type II
MTVTRLPQPRSSGLSQVGVRDAHGPATIAIVPSRGEAATSDVDALEDVLERALAKAGAAPCPPTLAHALRYAVVPGGARVRPRLALAIARATGDAHPALALAGAAAIELLHSASLVHDDLPCFDDAEERRGRASVHKAFGEPLAVLTGDALIVLAFELLAEVDAPRAKLGEVTRRVARAVGGPRGIIAGQAWESESNVDLVAYHRAKTGALFVAATTIGAIAGGGDPAAWSALGERIGEAYQVADDLKDALSTPDRLGKPVGRDHALGRPSAVASLGVEGAAQRLRALFDEAEASVPLCPGRAEVLSTFKGLATELPRAAMARGAT